MCDLSLLLIAVLIPSGLLRVLRLSPSSIIQFDLEEHFLTDYRGVLRVTYVNKFINYIDIPFEEGKKSLYVIIGTLTIKVPL